MWSYLDFVSSEGREVNNITLWLRNILLYKELKDSFSRKDSLYTYTFALKSMSYHWGIFWLICDYRHVITNAKACAKEENLPEEQPFPPLQLYNSRFELRFHLLPWIEMLEDTLFAEFIVNHITLEGRKFSQFLIYFFVITSIKLYISTLRLWNTIDYYEI